MSAIICHQVVFPVESSCDFNNLAYFESSLSHLLNFYLVHSCIGTTGHWVFSSVESVGSFEFKATSDKLESEVLIVSSLEDDCPVIDEPSFDRTLRKVYILDLDVSDILNWIDSAKFGFSLSLLWCLIYLNEWFCICSMIQALVYSTYLATTPIKWLWSRS